MIGKIAVLAFILALAACSSKGSQNSAENEDAGIKLYGAKVAATVQELPVCDSTLQGQLFFTLSDSTFYFCNEIGYSQIDLQGDKGIAGQTGVQGASGANGVNGVNGKNGIDGVGCAVSGSSSVKTISCGSTSATVHDGASCTIEPTLVGYDLTCGETTVSIMNGKDGKDGAAGKDGKDGAAGATGAAGKDGKDGVDGVDACVLDDDGLGTLTQTCGSTVVSWPKALCGEFVYDPGAYVCTNGALIAKVSAGNCGGAAYDPTVFACLNNKIVPKASLKDCAGTLYDPLVSACLADAVVPIASVKFCATVAYDPLTSVCYNDVVVPLTTCQNITYNAATQICDARDSKLYSYAKLGSLDWMTQNLNYEVNAGAGSWCYENNDANCATLGRLYDWSTARGAARSYNSALLNGGDADIQGVCPVGWRLPNNADWEALRSNWTAAKASFGYVNAGEYRADLNSWKNSDGNMLMWSVSENNATSARRYFVNSSKTMEPFSVYRKDYGHSVRCVRTPLPTP